MQLQKIVEHFIKYLIIDLTKTAYLGTSVFYFAVGVDVLYALFAIKRVLKSALFVFIINYTKTNCKIEKLPICFYLVQYFKAKIIQVVL